MAWTYDQTGITYEQPDLTYDGGTAPPVAVISGPLFGPGKRKKHEPDRRKRELDIAIAIALAEEP